MNYRRASARLAGLHLIGIAGVLSATAASLPGPDVPNEIVVQQAGEALGEQYQLVSTRIEAPAGAEFHFDAASITVTDAAVPTYRWRPTGNSPIPASVDGVAVLEIAAKYVGVPYVWGGSSPSGFDCTGFVQYVYAKVGVNLPRQSSNYWGIGTRVSAAQARPGDLIVSDGHVAIYAGGNLQIDAPRTGKTIQFRPIWQTSYVFIRVL